MRILNRSRRVVREELADMRPRHLLVRLLAAPLPRLTATRARANILKLGGYRIGRGVAFGDMPRIFGNGAVARRLVIGNHCFFNVGVTFELGERITIGRWVTFGPDVMLLTTTHEIGGPGHRCAEHVRAPIVIGDGVWIGARATVLPGVHVGDGAVVGASALVMADVEPNTVVAGVPARLVRRLDTPAPAAETPAAPAGRSGSTAENGLAAPADRITAV
jgi:maltose O-acetyltransferase